jgi:hypothetical protein
MWSDLSFLQLSASRYYKCVNFQQMNIIILSFTGILAVLGEEYLKKI